MNLEKLHNDIAAVAPIISVIVNDQWDKSTWGIQFTPEATDEEKAAAAAVVEAFDPADIDDWHLEPAAPETGP